MSKFCEHCGKEIHEDAVVCVHCGRLVGSPRSGMSGEARPRHPKENTALVYSVVGFVLSCIPIAGLVVSIIALNLVKKISADLGPGKESDSILACRILSIIGIVSGAVCTLILSITILAGCLFWLKWF